MKTFYRGIVVCAAVVVASTAWAQQTSQAQQTSDPVKPQVRTFEMVLRNAIETAGQNVARRARQMAPSSMADIAFAPGEMPVVNGFADHEIGLYSFQVQVPNISLTLQVMNMMMNAPAGRRAGSQPVGGRVSADGVVTPDPMDAPPVSLEREYRTQVRDALVDAILDNSGGLPMKPTDVLFVVASGVDQPAPNSLDRRTPASSLVLKVKASDLAEFRAGRITRTDAKERIQARSF